jgi:3-oxoacyl-[acyl-carrier-protein] synthase-3
MAFINEIETFFPEYIVTNSELENKMTLANQKIPEGTLEKLMGCHQRRRAFPDVQVSDLAVNATRNLMAPLHDVDMLIFAAASSDLIEPATANIVQQKLGLQCAVMDIKNACNSVTTAITVASALVDQKIYQKVLIVNGEKLGEVIQLNPENMDEFAKSVSGCSLGDGGCALLVSNQKVGLKIIHQKMKNWGEYWPLCTVAGGGSMHYRDESKLFFKVDAKGLKDAFLLHGFDFIKQALLECQWSVEDISAFITHQVSSSTVGMVSSELGFAPEKTHQIFLNYGNIAAATVPATLSDYLKKGTCKNGDKILLVGLAAGIGITVHCLEYLNGTL